MTTPCAGGGTEVVEPTESASASPPARYHHRRARAPHASLTPGRRRDDHGRSTAPSEVGLASQRRGLLGAQGVPGGAPAADAPRSASRRRSSTSERRRRGAERGRRRPTSPTRFFKGSRPRSRSSTAALGSDVAPTDVSSWCSSGPDYAEAIPSYTPVRPDSAARGLVGSVGRLRSPRESDPRGSRRGSG